MYFTVTTTCSSNAFATDLAKEIVKERLAACANIVSAVSSVYVWQERLENSHEVMIIFKTNGIGLDKLMAKIKQLHNYEIPMICAEKIEKIDPKYAIWIDENVRV